MPNFEPNTVILVFRNSNMSDKAAALKEKLANLKRKRQEAKSANHRDVSKNYFQAKKLVDTVKNVISGCRRG